MTPETQRIPESHYHQPFSSIPEEGYLEFSLTFRIFN